MQDASDRFEVERRDPPSAILQRLEGNTHQVIGYDWNRRLDRVVINDLRKFRKYDGRRVRDLLRVLRNKVGVKPVVYPTSLLAHIQHIETSLVRSR